MNSPEPGNLAKHFNFYSSIGLCFLIALWSVLFPEIAIPALRKFSAWALGWMGDAFVWAGSIFLVLLLILAASPLGKRRLGSEDSQPGFSTLSWWSMLFAAGMGTGLVVWGMAEPMTHAVQQPTSGDDPVAFILTNFHWGFHAWALYAAGALVYFFGFVHGKRYLPSSPIQAEFQELDETDREMRRHFSHGGHRVRIGGLHGHGHLDGPRWTHPTL